MNLDIKKKIIVTGGSGRFAYSLKKTKTSYKFIYPKKKDLNILSVKSIEKYLKNSKAKILLHLAGLSRPMIEHDNNINKSIDLNIIGTSNVIKACNKFNVKIIYFSTSYVYPGKKGNYKETDPILPWNNYAWSKLGGECAVQMYKNSLILRICMTEKPFIHKKAFSNVKMNFIFHQDLAKILIKLINKKGIINLGGPTKTIYNFAKKYNPKVKKITSDKMLKIKYPKNPYMNLQKLKNIIK